MFHVRLLPPSRIRASGRYAAFSVTAPRSEILASTGTAVNHLFIFLLARAAFLRCLHKLFAVSIMTEVCRNTVRT